MALKSFENKIIPNQLVHDHVTLLGLLEVLQASHITATLQTNNIVKDSKHSIMVETSRIRGKLSHKFSSSSSSHHSFFTRFPRLWNCLPSIDLHKSLSLIKSDLINYFITHFRFHQSSFVSLSLSM